MELKEVRIGELDQYLFGQGTHYDIYKKLGAHLATNEGKKGVYFAVWAPHAAKVHVVGDFNEWEEREAYEMTRVGEIGIYEIFVEGIGVGELYKFLITTSDGRKLYKADPYGNQAEFRPGTASRVTDISRLKWADARWLKARGKQNVDEIPMAIYEVHPGSWRKHPVTEEDPDGFYNYREFAHELTEYVKDMGYTHVELMGIAEHPFDGSWGYQVIGYYAPTARYGTPEDFQYMVNYFHKNGIGVILDWVPAHFPKDAAGLADFDGQALYEYADPRKGEHPDWGTKVFDYAKNEVKNFLIANALYWVEQFHIDGLRVDAVASMLYLDYGRSAGNWVPNIYGENKNLEAIEFFKHLNTVVTGRNHGTMIIAEESTAWPQVTGRPEDGGLGFTMKWNMGWMHDFLDYMKLDPYFRSYNHNKMTFSMTYAFSEKYVLVLSHDEVVHMKGSMINKMPGEYDDKFANLKAGYSFMMGHPGKKLLFMGQDFAQFREWSEARELDWYLLAEEKHVQMKEYVKELLHLYQGSPALYETDDNWEGFEWVNADDSERSIFSFIRHSKDGKNNLLFVVNFTPVERPEYRVGVPQSGSYKLVLNSDEARFGGSGEKRASSYRSKKGVCDNKPYSIGYSLPAYGVAVFQYEKKDKTVKKATARKNAVKKETTARKTSAAKKTAAKKNA
ncbi:1%2C4-alpha-glucan branching enzyme GlgB [uncultured Clostridium sp.]|uniref:1,4-alpha-glucan branching enzyme GlgB n=1 Tax=Muricoprocola aceti TaxID=2981772 RepID=A0ABT2SL48_9FIRM|nr:1,4-alpha-glucan branching protein GlgB [Muricoprocola aceti]MCI7225894.1 1,4-alpha-glucan branching protein GlgB [Lachnospiraceae bacterium]SCH44113.1 1%2C4-alpha-glucan branching enzyme GlgB [uncultured Clostridium sp.]MCU6725231.1 1,4-alpha-glucan branching protein GlgB [Muricoprocola aceti]MDD7435577.1 1,4-alpha-glucan branching protein GlgB [Lachnospiraceae bacterium]MDY3342669.1 1,4-alpha-glucan branching protein GlgB [Lachnospiraceae bacterium]